MTGRSIALVGAIALAFRVDFLLGVAVCLLLVWGLGRWLPRSAVNGVTVTRHHPERIFYGEGALVTVRAANHGRLPVPWLVVTDGVPFDLNLTVGGGKWATTLLPGEERSFTYRLAGRRRGLHRIGPGSTVTGDLFGTGRFPGPSFADSPMVVYPKIVPVGRAALPAGAPVPVIRTRTPWHDDPSRIIGVRGYRSGDSTRRIHWPATAALGELMVKQYQPGISRDTVVCLDLTRAGYRGTRRRSGVELAVTVGASLLHHVIVADRLPAGMAVAGVDPLTGGPVAAWWAPRADRGHLITMLDLLARVTVDPDGDFPAALRVAGRRLSWGSTVAVVTGTIDERLASAVLALGGHGSAVSVFHVLPPAGADGSWSVRLGAEGVVVREVEREADLEGG